jgi:VanZ family protein
VRRRSGWRLYICLATFAAGFVATHTPPSGMPNIQVSDKLLHFVGYLVLGSLALWQGLTPNIRPGRKTLLMTLFCLAAYAAFDEITQPLVGRACELMDWTADTGGAIMGLTLVSCVHYRMFNRH